MSDFNPQKLKVTLIPPANSVQPIEGRKYTLTHSDITAELFLDIGYVYNFEAINRKMRDEVLGEWVTHENCLYFNVFLYIDQGEYDLTTATKREEVFRRELPLALTAIRYGDRFLFHLYPDLNNPLIIVNFISTYPPLAKQEVWQTFNSFTT